MGGAITGVGELLSNSGGGPACLGQLLDQLADLRIRTQLAQLANRSNHDALGVASAEPLDAHLDPLAAALHIHDDPFDNLANDLFAIGCGGGWGGPEGGNIRRQVANGLSLGFVSSRRGLCWTNR